MTAWRSRWTANKSTPNVPAPTYGASTTVTGGGFWAYPNAATIRGVRLTLQPPPAGTPSWGTTIARYRKLGVYALQDGAGNQITKSFFQNQRVDYEVGALPTGIAYDWEPGVSVQFTEVLATSLGNLLQVILHYEGSFTADAGTVRATYTVPANREAQLESASLSTTTGVTPTAAGWRAGLLRALIPPGPVTVDLCGILASNVAPMTTANQVEAPGVVLRAGTTAQLFTYNFDTGGMSVFFLSALFNEYDAGTLQPMAMQVQGESQLALP
jgi:hypothetical protein